MNILERLDSRGGSTAPRWLRLAGGAILAAFLVATLASCTGDDTAKSKAKKSKRGSEEASGEEGGGSSEDLVAEVDSLVEKAKRLGAEKSSGEALATIEKLIASAADAEGEASTKKYKAVISRLKRLIDEQIKLNESVKKLATTRAEVDEVKKKADAAKASENSPILYKEAQDLLKKATDALAKPTLESVDLASKSLLQAKDRFEQAATSAADSVTFRKQAEDEKKELLKYKDLAKAKQADEKAPSDWLQANQAEREADGFFAKAEFQTAVEIYKQATRQYLGALQAVQSEEENRELNAKMAAEALAAGQARPALPAAEPEANPVTPAPRGTPVPTPVPQVAPVVSGSAPLPEGFNADVFKQELDAEDEAFLTEHYKKLTPSGIIQYDVSTGAVSLDYTLGKDVKADVQTPGMQKAWINYKPMMEMPKNLSPEKQREYAAYSFEGNTQGYVIFPVPFRFFSRVEWDMGIGTMDNNASFSVLLMFDPKKKGAFMTDWLKTGIMKAGQPNLGAKGLPPQFLKPANEWFLKTRNIPMRVDYQMSDAKTGKFSITYDVDGDEQQVQALPGTNYTRGKVAFKWSRVKFRVVTLHMSGILDKEAAVAILRQTLKMPRAKAAKEKKEEPKPEPDPGVTGGDGAGGGEGGAEPTTGQGADGGASEKSKSAGGAFEH